MSLEYSMTVKLLTEHHLEFLSFKGGCTGVKMAHRWKSHVAAQMNLTYICSLHYSYFLLTNVHLIYFVGQHMMIFPILQKKKKKTLHNDSI